MKKVYFNHSLLVDAPDVEITRQIVDVADFKNTLGVIPLYVYVHFWGLRIQSGTLRSFLTHQDNRDRAKVLILALMHNGPHFHDLPAEEMANAAIVPEVKEQGFGKTLLHICFNDFQEYILSLACEKILIHKAYTLSSRSRSVSIVNLIGKTDLLRQLQGQLVFKNIDDVFREFARSSPRIEILSSAVKSAGRHNFKGAFQEVYRTVTALQSELSLLVEGIPDQQRIEKFLQQTGFEISGESPGVLKNPKFRKHREFVIGSKGKVLFDWHIKIGNETRVHFFIDKEEKKIYIGHCGKHLPIPSYKS